MSAARVDAGLGRRIVAGLGWVVATRLVVRMLGVAGTLILARLLSPDDFGLVALATAVTAGVAMLGSFGIEAWLVREPAPDRRHYDTVWTLSVMRGAAIAAVLWLVSDPAASAFGDPRLAVVLQVLAASSLVSGLRNVGVLDFQRDLEFDRDFMLYTVPRVGAFVATVALGIWLRSYWALVAGIVVRRALDVALTFRVHAYRPAPGLRLWRPVVSFSKWLLAGNCIAFAYQRADTFLIGKLIGTEALGLYTVARTLADVASTEVAMPIRRVMLPGFARLGGEPARLRAAFFDGYALIVLIGLPCAAGVALLAEPLVRVLLGEQWLASIPLVRMLSLYAITAVVMANQGPLFLALGHARLTTALVALGLVLLLPALPWAITAHGPVGAAAALSGVNAVVLVASLGASLRLLDAGLVDLLAVTWRPGVAAAVMVTSLSGWLAASGSLASFAVLAAGVGLGVATYGGTVYLLWRVCGRPAGAESILIDYVASRRRAGRGSEDPA